MNLIELYSKVYNPPDYTCVHFVIDSWKMLYSIDISENILYFYSNMSSNARMYFKHINILEDQSVIVMFRRKHSPHLGLIHNKKVLHLNEHGVEYTSVEVACRGFDRYKLYHAHNSLHR